MKESVFFKNEQMMRNVVGICDQNIRTIEKKYNVSIAVKQRECVISGSSEAAVVNSKKAIMAMVENESISTADQIVNSNTFVFSHYKKTIIPQTPGQKKFVESIYKKNVTFCIGPAGTGKTYLSMALAVEFLKTQKVERIILSRPAVESGEKLGYLPGDLAAKINPYLRPLYDALHEMMPPEEIQEKMDRNIIEVVPLAYMRGRTLNDSFVILDEAQNASQLQVKMFLTRLGFGSHMVVTGDITQSDIGHVQKSGLIEAEKILKGVKSIAFNYLTEKDVVRHALVKEILKAYEHYDCRKKK